MKAQIIITLEDDNNVKVEGPITDKILTFGLLQIAHDSVKDFNDQRKKGPQLLVAPAGSVPGVTQ